MNLHTYSYYPTVDPDELEFWKAIPGYEANYWASNLGRIKGRVKVLTWTVNRVTGYPRVNLYKNGKNRTFTVHVLIARTFLGPRPEGLVIDHLHGNKLDPRVNELEYVTHIENERRAAAMGLKASGKRNGHYTCPAQTSRGPAHSKIMLEVAARGDRNGSRKYPERRPRGERNTEAKLTVDQVRAMRQKYEQGLGTQTELAAEFGVCPASVSYIVRRIHWTHVT